MKQCAYCGKEFGPEVTVCAIDGNPVKDIIAPSPAVSKPFFRWKIVSVSLISLAILYWGIALLNLWLPEKMRLGGNTQNSAFYLQGAFWNVIVGALCLGGRRLMKSSRNLICGTGAFAVASALLIIMHTWLAGLLTGRNPFPVVEAIMIWPWLIYAAMYAVSTIQKRLRADAPPNGGPATQLGNSGVTEGPPSVS